jgi:hypothetical protein
MPGPPGHDDHYKNTVEEFFYDSRGLEILVRYIDSSVAGIHLPWQVAHSSAPKVYPGL